MMSEDFTDDLSVHSSQSQGEQSKVSSTRGSSVGSSYGSGNAIEQLKLLRKDSWIQSLRFLSLCILLVVAYVVAMTVYVSLKSAEYREFENQFDSQSEQIGEGIRAELAIKLQAMEALSVAVTAHAESQSGMTWPNMTLPQFSYRSANTLTIGGGISVGIQPIVRREQQNGWEEYAVQHQGWRDESIVFQEKHKDIFWSTFQNENLIDVNLTSIPEHIFHVIDGFPTAIENELMMPVWQYSPIDPRLPYVNYDQYGKERNREALNEVVEKEAAVLGMFFNLSQSLNGHDFDTIDQEGDEQEVEESKETLAVELWYPVFSNTTDDRLEVAVISMTTAWESFILPRLPPNPLGLIAVLSNECGQVCTFDISGDAVTYLGLGDSHDKDFDYYEKEFYFMEEASKVSNVSLSSFCKYKMTVYPSTKMRDSYRTNDPINFTGAVASIFIFTIIVFVAYDNLVERRQKFLAHAAQKSNAIVTALFPKIVQERLFLNDGVGPGKTAASKMKALSGDSDRKATAPPIADLFAHTTVMFGDIAGFTAWSSSRQPSQVFILLETLYGSFDKIAREMNVFKVETIGDCYVAATGLPNPQQDHHLRMVRFARCVLSKLSVLTQELEVTLGPDTTNLGFRIGINSGPVTAGVLRGERSRFQLFGDTVNMASRMESTGKTNQIQVSEATADLINASRKSHWIRKREELVEARGKGHIQTFWVKQNKTSSDKSDSFRADSFSVNSSDTINPTGRKPVVRKSLIEWQIELLSRLLKQIVYHRELKGTSKSEHFATINYSKGLPRDEIAEKISMPAFAPAASKRDNIDIDSIELPVSVVLQLEDLATSISQLYHDNAFHNYEHACHVTMSANKLLQRIVVPKFQDTCEVSKEAHDYTYGLTSDPLTQFAIIFSAIIHDLDHHGVSNNQLTKERNRIALMYDDKSVAEQNSIDLAFDLLTSPCYSDLVSCICADETEYNRLRQLIVNCVMATDIFDKELLDLRNNRWTKAFNDNCESTSDLKATIVIEHIIQAADVAHTMQHWHVYQKWNERLFAEMCKAYETGRGADKDPASGWYEGELWFFDNYVIPLARKLDECGVFGVSSDECLNYALENRREWESKGRGIVLEMSSRHSMARIEEGES